MGDFQPWLEECNHIVQRMESGWYPCVHRFMRDILKLSLSDEIIVFRESIGGGWEMISLVTEQGVLSKHEAVSEQIGKWACDFKWGWRHYFGEKLEVKVEIGTPHDMRRVFLLPVVFRTGESKLISRHFVIFVSPRILPPEFWGKTAKAREADEMAKRVFGLVVNWFSMDSYELVIREHFRKEITEGKAAHDRRRELVDELLSRRIVWPVEFQEIVQILECCWSLYRTDLKGWASQYLNSTIKGDTLEQKDKKDYYEKLKRVLWEWLEERVSEILCLAPSACPLPGGPICPKEEQEKKSLFLELIKEIKWKLGYCEDDEVWPFKPEARDLNAMIDEEAKKRTGGRNAN